MLVKIVNLVALGAALGILGGCSTPCDAPGGLCAPLPPITSVPPAPPAGPPPVPVLSAPMPEPAETFSVDSPDSAAAPDSGAAVPALVSANPPNSANPDAAAAPASGVGGKPVRIGLMLPLRSETLGPAAEAVRAGFMAAYERDRAGITVNIIDTGDSGQDTLASFAAAQDREDVMVGPLARSAVTALAGSALVRKPTIALNHPEGRGTQDAIALPPQMLVIGLSIEDEARQVASWAAGEHTGASALILSAGAPWQRRVAGAFAAQWQELGAAQQSVEMSALNGYLSDAELVQLRARLQNAPPGLLFLAMDADQARQLRVALGPLGAALPVYGTSGLNPGEDRVLPGPELDGVRLLDLPWQVQRDHPAVMTYPRQVQNDERSLTADMERLYALGIDAFRVAREAGRNPGGQFTLDGVTGKLSVMFAPGQARFERSEQGVMYQNGALVPATAPTQSQQPQLSPPTPERVQ